MVFTCY